MLLITVAYLNWFPNYDRDLEKDSFGLSFKYHNPTFFQFLPTIQCSNSMSISLENE